MDPETTLPHIQWVPGFIPGDKADGGSSHRSTPSSVKFKNEWIYTSTPPISLHVLGRDNFTFTLYCSLCSTAVNDNNVMAERLKEARRVETGNSHRQCLFFP